MPKLIKRVAVISKKTVDGKVKCGVIEKDITNIYEDEFARMNSNNVEVSL
ncbi:MAG: hypothetical protein IJ458_00885 [Clostridia bacterium]|nr:hypothetical protein [Clostridia bacterium]